MLSKRQRKFFGILAGIAAFGLILSSVGGSLFFLIGN
jgi:hypothetical protein